MRLVFAYDHRFYRGAGGELYTSGAFRASAWDRYLKHFDELHVLGRDGGTLPRDVNLGRSDRDRVTFEFLPNLSSLRQLVAPSAEARYRMTRAVESADAVVARVASEIGLMAIREARRLGRPYAIEVVGCAWDGFVHHGSPIARAYAPLLFQRTRNAVKNAPLALYVTSQWLQGRYPTRGFSVSASNVEITSPDAEALSHRERRLKELFDGRLPRLGTIATLKVKTKGIQTALAALAKLRSRGLNLTYSVLGAGDRRPWQQLASQLGVADLVSFDGTRDTPEAVRQWLDELDVYLQPSFQEGLPRATIEAMSRGLACIGSTCGGIPEVVPAERTHRPGDVNGLAVRIEQLATNPAAIAEASRQGFETSKAYLPEILVARRAELYSRLRDLAACAD